MLIPLYIRSVETQRRDNIIRDDKSVEMVEGIDYDFARFDKAWKSQLGVAIRTEILDEATRAFIRQYPDATVVNLGAGLCTRFTRVDNGRITWYELDLPEVIELRGKFFTETERYRSISESITEFGWMEQLQGRNPPVLFIGEGLFMYFEEAEVKRIFLDLAARFPGSELLFEINGPATVGRGKHHDALPKMDERPEFKWGPASGAECATWDTRIQFVQEWNYVDRHRGRWRYLRLIAYIPPLKRWISNKIVHLKFV